MDDLDGIFPTLKFQIGEVEFNHSIEFEPYYYLEKFGSVLDGIQ